MYKQGKRPAEIAVIEASLDSAIAQATEAERIEKRQGLLLIKGITTKANFDDASTKFELARTKIVEIEATLTAARLPARPNEIKAASAQVARAGAVVQNANWRLSSAHYLTRLRQQFSTSSATQAKLPARKPRYYLFYQMELSNFTYMFRKSLWQQYRPVLPSR